MHFPVSYYAHVHACCVTSCWWNVSFPVAHLCSCFSPAVVCFCLHSPIFSHLCVCRQTSPAFVSDFLFAGVCLFTRVCLFRYIYCEIISRKLFFFSFLIDFWTIVVASGFFLKQLVFCLSAFSLAVVSQCPMLGLLVLPNMKELLLLVLIDDGIRSWDIFRPSHDMNLNTVLYFLISVSFLLVLHPVQTSCLTPTKHLQHQLSLMDFIFCWSDS